MWPSLIALFALIIFAILLVHLFFFTLVDVIINMVVLYFVFLRVYTEVAKYKKGDAYVLSGLAGIFIAIIIGKVQLLWPVTIAALSALIIAQLYHLLRR